MTGYAPVARVTADDPYEEAEAMKNDVGDGHRVVDVLANAEVFVEEEAEIGTRWTAVATVDTGGHDDGQAADNLAQDLTSDSYRVVFDYCAGEWLVEKEVEDDA